ncbi:MAG: ribosome maturation factor RimM [Firmicutes bacterium]|nr:ribosome maturation factor RimM [Bacillota bacterium]
MEKNKSPYLPVGEIINTHGVRGTVKARSDCDSPEILSSLPRIFIKRGRDYASYDVVSASIQKGFVLISLLGVSGVDAAAALKGSVIYAERSELEKFLGEGDRFIADLIGMPIIHADTKETLGTLREVFNVGASDIYVVDTKRGERMMPAVPEFVSEMTEDGIYVRPIEGMLD